MADPYSSHHLRDVTEEVYKSPHLFDPILLDPHTVRILVLTDDDGSFSPEHRFGLSELVNALRSETFSFVNFKVTTAHRSPKSSFNLFPKDAMLPEFRFDNPKLFKADDYDEIWFFGVANDAPDTGVQTLLSETEKKIVAQFMDNGGGVFATGDHENLGQLLCGWVPRVRSMRKWQFDYTKVTGSHTYDDYDESGPDAPPVLGRHRHDTLQAGHDNAFAFDDQSDDVPAKMGVKWYTSPVDANIVRHYPHPILCGPHGVLRTIPDHMHEGECIIPEDFNQKYTFDGYTGTEYPTGPHGLQPRPDVIAWLTVTSNHQTRLEYKDSFGGQPGQTNEQTTQIDRISAEDTYGSIGAYDGHPAEVGRVVVDSTFHHFFNINMIGSGSNSSDPVKQKGYNASPAGQAAYEEIKAYYRNIALWLARPQNQDAMFHTALWTARWDSQLRMQAPRIGHEAPAWETLRAYGLSVRETMERLASTCIVFEWTTGILDPLSRLLASPWYELLHRPDPPHDGYGQAVFDPEELVTALLGGIMAGIFAEAPSRSQHFRAEVYERMPGIVANGAAMGVRQAVEVSRARLRATERYLNDLSRAVQGRGGQRT
jgi:hypothetical protein